MRIARISAGLGLCVLATTLAACSGPPPVHYDYDRMASFSEYRSFNFLATRATATANPDDARVKRAIVLDLTERGYLQGGGDKVFLISYDLAWEGKDEVLAVEFVDAATSRRLWTGSTRLVDMAGDPWQQDEAMRQNVARLLSYFPPPQD